MIFSLLNSFSFSLSITWVLLKPRQPTVATLVRLVQNIKPCQSRGKTHTMSTTSVTTLVIPAMKGVVISENKCPMCWGEGFPQDGSGAHDRIQELEGQVHTLTARALAAGKPVKDLYRLHTHKCSMNAIPRLQRRQYFPPLPLLPIQPLKTRIPANPIANSLQT